MNGMSRWLHLNKELQKLIDRAFFAANFVSKRLWKNFYKDFLLPKIKDFTKILCYEILEPYSIYIDNHSFVYL